MKIVFLVASILCLNICFAQTDSFKIISFRGNVTLDGTPITCGQTINTSSSKFIIEKAGYAIVLTSNGYAFQLGKGRYTTKEIATYQYSNLHDLINTARWGAVTRDRDQDRYEIKLIFSDRENPNFIGDSLTLIWKTLPNVKEYHIKVTTAFDSTLYETTVSEAHVTVPISTLGVPLPVFYQIHYQNLKPKIWIIKPLKNNEQQNFEFDLKCINEQDPGERELMMLALCEIYSLYYDQIHHLYKIWRHNKATKNQTTHPYYERISELYKLDSFLN